MTINLIHSSFSFLPFAKETPQLMNSLEEKKKKTLKKLRTKQRFGLLVSFMRWKGAEGGRARSRLPQRNLRGGSSKVEGNTNPLQAPQTRQ